MATKITDLPMELRLEFISRFTHVLSCGRKYRLIFCESAFNKFLKEKGYED